jgi:uncharacterized membrane protein
MEHHFHLHPLIVHFPIALFITAFGLEILSLIFKKESLHQASWYNYILAIFATIAAILAAWWDKATVKHPVFYTHKTLAYWTLGVALLSGVILPLVRRKSKRAFRIIFFIFLILTMSLVSITGYYGGKLVYEYGVGVHE